MDWNHIFLGLLQGLTEFLPVSSSGHLFLAEKILNSSQISLSFILLLHLATLLAVLLVFFKDIKAFALGFQESRYRQLFFKLFLSLTPLLFIGLFFRPFIAQSFEKNAVALGFLSTGLLLFSLFFVPKGQKSLEEMSFFQAFLIGLAQALAVLPGFSRSAWTIATGFYCGLSPRAAVYFSFLISLPAVAGSSLIDLSLSLLSGSSLLLKGEAIWTLFFAFSLAFASGILSLLMVLKFAKSQKLAFFSFYLLPLSALVFFISHRL